MKTGRRAVVVGDGDAFASAAARVGLRWEAVREGVAPRQGVGVWTPAPSDEPVEVASLRLAVREIQEGRGRALVTGPIHKARLAARGFQYPGHTEFLGALAGVDHPVMAFLGGPLTVVLATVHLPLAQVPGALTRAGLLRTLTTADAAFRQFGRRPLWTVCGLNPHAGDGGVLGREEIDVIGPAVVAARALGIDVDGPVSAETAFRLRDPGRVVLAMYHDQGLVALKRVDFGRTVNWTMGLPFVRTSVDHGTADALVGTGLARADSMVAALRLAHQLSPR